LRHYEICGASVVGAGSLVGVFFSQKGVTMSVRDLTLGQLDVVFHGWLGGDAEADLASDARLAAWRPSVEAALARVRSTSAGKTPDLTDAAPAQPTPVELDRLAEASLRALGWALSAAEQVARAAARKAGQVDLGGMGADEDVEPDAGVEPADVV